MNLISIEVVIKMSVKKIKSVMIGHAVGDALGVPVEFKSREYIAQNPISEMVGFGTYNFPAGTWSDDTSMSLCALSALIKKSWSFESVMDNFCDWLSNNKFTATGETFDVGYTCFNAIINYRDNKTNVTECGLADEYSNGNGSLMRIHPFALMVYYNKHKYPNWENIIEQASALTHAHERSKLACKIYTMVLFAILDNPSKNAVSVALKQAYNQYYENPEHNHFERLFLDDFHKLASDKIKSTGYVIDTLEASIWCLMNTDSYKECVLTAVNLGEDTDTVAAIAGSLAGALYGFDSIPEDWRNTLKRIEYIEELCEKFSLNCKDD